MTRSLSFTWAWATSCKRAGRLEEAERAFKSVLELDPDSFQARYNLGVTYTNMDRVKDAVAQYEAALQVDPKHPQVAATLNNLGAIFLAASENDRALEKFEAAVKASPFNLESRYNAGVIYLEQDRVEEAIEILEEASALESNHHMVHVRLAMAYLRKGRNQDAYRSFLLVRRLYPRDWSATLGLALIHAGAKEDEQARNLLKEALQLGGKAARASAETFPLLKPLLEK